MRIFAKLSAQGATPYQVHKANRNGAVVHLLTGRTENKLKYDKMQKIAGILRRFSRLLIKRAPSKKPLVNNDEELTEYLEELKTALKCGCYLN